KFCKYSLIVSVSSFSPFKVSVYTVLGGILFFFHFYHNDRFYAWTSIDEEGRIKLNKETFDYLGLKISERLLVIRSSSLAFTLGAKGPVFERVALSKTEIGVY
ncbi:MAG TPA: hypothetical protein PLA84_10985, partial [Petrotogaceae bacterium]|nr:hypothetical protein [Petrotogaceae bacterium]